MADVFELQCPCNEFQFTDPEDSWETWNGLRGPAGPAGPPGAPGPGVQLRGPVPSTAYLPATAPSGELWLVGAASPYDGWFYNGTSWQNAGQIAVGPAGPAGADGSDGTTFTPSVSSAGVISWTNDGGKANPDPVNIKGPQGDPGSAGAPGAPGSDGTTFTPSVSSAGVISWTNDGGKANPDPVNIKGPQGEPGSAGAPGAAATIAVGTVSGLPAGSAPTVTNSGSSAAAVFDFGIPAGATGPTGPAGPGVAAGGSPGQVLAKTSGSDYATGWITPEVGGGALYFPSVPMTATTGTIISISNAAITEDYVLSSVVFSRPAAVTAGGTFSSGAGTFSMTGTCTDATCTAQITLVKKSN